MDESEDSAMMELVIEAQRITMEELKKKASENGSKERYSKEEKELIVKSLCPENYPRAMYYDEDGDPLM